jgi:hypothetical protein
MIIESTAHLTDRPSKVARSETAQHRGCVADRPTVHFATLIDYREFHAAFLDIDDRVCGIALGEDGLLLAELSNLSRNPNGFEIHLRTE